MAAPMFRSPRLWALIPAAVGLVSACQGAVATKGVAPPPPVSVSLRATVAPEPEASIPVPTPPVPEPEVPDTRPMLSTRDFTTPIFDQPSFGSPQLGYLRAGTRVVRSRDAIEAKAADGCPGGWYKIEPNGYVCNGRYGATINLRDPGVVAAERSRPRHAPLPFGYGNSMGAPGYDRIPTADEVAKREPDIDGFRKRALAEEGRLHPDQRSPKLALPLEPIPASLTGHAKIPLLNSPTRLPYIGGNVRIAFVSAFESLGRSYYLTTEHLVVPAERIKAARLTSFRGVDLSTDGSKGPRLPMVWMRLPPLAATAHVYVLEGDAVTETEVTLPYQSWAEVEDKDVVIKGTRYHKLRTPPAGLPERVGGKPAEYGVKWPAAARLDAMTKLPATVEAGEIWIDVSLSRQTLVVYEGLVPRFATLVSTGAGGKNKDTPWGNYRVYQKHHTTKMSGRENPAEGEHFYRFDDVPYTQYLVRGIAIHASFWHDGFGVARSHGCINMSPWDAQKVFGMTSPSLPHGWHGIYPNRGSNPPGTLVQIRG
jgi:hypothetical protein